MNITDFPHVSSQYIAIFWLSHSWLVVRRGFKLAARRATHLSLLSVLLLVSGQYRWGELVPYGIELAVAAGFAILGFVYLREREAAKRESALTGEISALTERIDSLVAQVGRDPLTGLLNRRSLRDRLEYELEHGRLVGKPVGLALIDVDNFKQVNDTLGHAVGDQVLQAVASILIGACRSSDVAARYAGDEFVMIFPGADERTAGQVSQRIVEYVRKINDQLKPASGIRITLSVGLAITHRCHRNAAQLVAIADAAMYDAKESGKDRVVAFDADTLTLADYGRAEPASSQAGELRPSRDERRVPPDRARTAS